MMVTFAVVSVVHKAAPHYALAVIATVGVRTQISARSFVTDIFSALVDIYHRTQKNVLSIRFVA